MSLFITFEGPDGSGKSTQIGLTAKYLADRGYPVLCTREPGGTRIGDRIREILHDASHSEMAAQTELLLYTASRAQLVQQVILPHLKQDGIVLCDRYADSTYAYQGYGRRLDFDFLRSLTKFATQALKPDITIYLDMDVGKGLKRKAAANTTGQGEWNRMDQLELDFHQRVRSGYLAMAQAQPERWLIIDAAGSVDEIHQIIRAHLDPILIEQSSAKELRPKT